MENRQGYTKEQLINSLSIASQLKVMFDTLRRVAKMMMVEKQTQESQQFVLNVFQLMKDYENYCSKLIIWHREQLDELINLEALWNKPP